MQLVYLFIASIFSCSVTNYIIYDFAESLFERSYDNKNLYNIFYIGITSLAIFSNVSSNITLNYIVTIIMVIVITKFLYYSNDKSVVILTIAFLSFLLAIESGVAVFIPFVFEHILTLDIVVNYRYLLQMILSLIIIVPTYYIIKTFISSKTIVSNYCQSLGYVLLSSLSFLAIMDIILLAKNEKDFYLQIFTMIIIVGIAILDLVLIYFYQKISENSALELELELITQQAKLEFKHYNKIKEKYEQSKKLSHDIKGHLHAIEALYKKDEISRGDNYAKKLLYVVEKFDSPYTSNNSILEIIINERITMCDMYNINFEYNIRYDDLSFINDMDLVSLLSNLLNNAVEATEKIQNGYVNLVIDRFNDFLVINVTNPYINIKKDIKGKFKTTKEEHHGVGLVNIRNIIKLYSGEISINTENNVFEVKIIIPIKTTVS